MLGTISGPNVHFLKGNFADKYVRLTHTDLNTEQILPFHDKQGQKPIGAVDL